MAVAVKRVSAVVRVPWGGNILEAVEDGFKSGLADAQAKLGALSAEDRGLVERWHDSIVWSRLREILSALMKMVRACWWMRARTLTRSRVAWFPGCRPGGKI